MYIHIYIYIYIHILFDFIHLFKHFFTYLFLSVYAHRQACEAVLQNYEIRDPAIIQSASDQIRPIKSCRGRIRRRRD